MTDATTDLSARWQQLAGTSDAAAALGADLLRRWSEPHRAYHNVDHLRAALRTTDELLTAEPEASPVVVRHAVWFHDAIYDPRRGDNEELSAALAVDALPSVGIAVDVVDRVAALVRMTATHEPADADANADARVLVDADLAVLAWPFDDYDAYASAVRKEYGFVEWDTWRQGRSAVLERLLARAPLYLTDTMHRFEDRARNNMRRELSRLV